MSRMDELLDAFPEQMNVPDVARFLAMDARTVRRWLAENALPGVALPHGGWIIWREELRAWMHAAHNQRGGQKSATHPPDQT